MTVVVGFVSDEGAVMASDSHATEPDRTHHSEEKIWASHGLLFGYTGNTAIGDPLQAKLDNALEGFDSSQPREIVKTRLCAIVRGVLEPAYTNFLPVPGEHPVRAALEELGGALLVIGRDHEYWLLDINHRCTATYHMTRRFHTVGSGAQGAQVVNSLLEHHETAKLSLWKLKLIAYRSVSACTSVLAPVGVGGDVQLWASADPEFVQATKTELEGLEREVEEWHRDESEGFDRMARTGADPLPEDLG